jgi:hypothetical protein
MQDDDQREPPPSYELISPIDDPHMLQKIKSGIVFVVYFQSPTSIIMLSQFGRILKEHDPQAMLRLIVIDLEELIPLDKKPLVLPKEDWIDLGFALWIQDGKPIGQSDESWDSSLIDGYTQQLLKSLES